MPPPPPLNGSVPSRRLPTQPQAEVPSCVQNAMMKQDKKPFTYTPTGIDLSQIKSPRMAQRLIRNANSEGVPSHPKPPQVDKSNLLEKSKKPTFLILFLFLDQRFTSSRNK